MSEAELQAAVLELAHLLKWRVAHFRAARTAHGGWRTAVSGDGAGFVDLVLVRDRVVFCELKSAKGALSPEQVLWRDALLAAGCEWHLFRPEQWTDATIERVLRRRP